MEHIQIVEPGAPGQQNVTELLLARKANAHVPMVESIQIVKNNAPGPETAMEMQHA